MFHNRGATIHHLLRERNSSHALWGRALLLFSAYSGDNLVYDVLEKHLFKKRISVFLRVRSQISWEFLRLNVVIIAVVIVIVVFIFIFVIILQMVLVLRLVLRVIVHFDLIIDA